VSTARRRRRRPRDDDGQMAAAMVIFLGMTVLAFFVVALVPVGAATNERSRSQTAADAAALAGAEEIRTQWVNVSTFPGVLTYPLVPLPPVTPASGAAAATGYAAQNGSHVLEYRANPASGRVYAKVESNSAAYPEHGRSVSEATAEMDADFLGCRWDDPVPPPPVPQGGPPLFDRTLTCGAWEATYQIANTVGLYPTVMWVGTTMTDLYDDLEPRLVR
jgi:hypothetical protein